MLGMHAQRQPQQILSLQNADGEESATIIIKSFSINTGDVRRRA
jgi:hypothetical protein